MSSLVSMDHAGGSFGELLVRHRQAAGLSQRAVAVRAGLSERAVRDLERGSTAQPRPQSVRLLASAMGLAGDELTAFLAAASEAIGAPQRPRILESQASEFVGRQAELRQLADLVHGLRHRIITVTGPGGVGKSRLAAEVVPRLRQAGLDVRTLDLSTLENPALALELIAEVTASGSAARMPAVERVAISVGRQRLVLVLDGMERFVTTGPELATLVRRCPALTLLLTSQRPLHLRGERLVPLCTLPHRDAVDLLVRRATSLAPDFELTQANEAAVSAICQAIDGLPLALELAAARLRLLAPQELANRLDRPLEVLTGGAQDLPERHRSLRAAITASLDAVSQAARSMFGGLAPFASGMRVDDLDAIVQRLPEPTCDHYAALAELVDLSLVQVRRRDQVTRYVLPKALREMALEVFATRPDRLNIERAVTQTYLIRLTEAAASPDGSGFAELDPDADNVRAALAWAQRHDPGLADTTVVQALYRYTESRGRFVEGRDTLVALADAGATGAAWALVAAGTMCRMLHDPQQAVEMIERARQIIRPEDHSARTAMAMLEGSLALESGAIATAVAKMETARDFAFAEGDGQTAGRALHNLGSITNLIGDRRRAEAYFLQALQARRQAHARDNDLALTLMNLADLSLGDRNWSMAAAHASEAAALFQRGGHPRFRALSLSTQAIALLGGGQGRPEQAHRCVQEALSLLDAFGDERPHRGLIEARATVVSHAFGRLDGLAEQARRGLGDMPGGLTQYEIAPIIEAHACLLAARHPVTAARLLGLGAAVRRAEEHPQPALLSEPAVVLQECLALLGESALQAELDHGARLLAHGAASATAALLTEALEA